MMDIDLLKITISRIIVHVVESKKVLRSWVLVVFWWRYMEIHLVMCIIARCGVCEKRKIIRKLPIGIAL